MATDQCERAYRVVHAGTGLTGRQALAAIIDDPVLELVGLHVTTPEKVGVDAGQLCGRPDIGVYATDDVNEVIALRPDCLCYCATAVRRERQAVADIARYLSAGINVVTISTIPMVYPAAAPQTWRDSLESAAQQGNSTFYATGSEPGVISLNIATALLSCAGQVDSYRMDEYATRMDEAYPIWDVLHESMGFAKPDGYIPARIASGKVNHDWETVVRYIADILGLRIDGVELDWETTLAPHDLDSAVGLIPAGTICGHRWQLAGVVDGQPTVAVQYFATLATTPWPADWPRPPRGDGAGMVYRIQGRPKMSMELRLEQHDPDDPVNPGVHATAMAVVNAIPAVVNESPGVIQQPLSGPSIVTRQSRSTTP